MVVPISTEPESKTHTRQAETTLGDSGGVKLQALTWITTQVRHFYPAKFSLKWKHLKNRNKGTESQPLIKLF